jgi:hypothetical protein
MLGVNVLQHCLSRQRAWVSDGSAKVFGALSVRAATTDKDRTSIVFMDAVHGNYSVHDYLPISA